MYVSTVSDGTKVLEGYGIRETTYDSTDAILKDKVYELDDDTGRRIGYKVYDGEGNLIEEVVY